MIALLLAAAGWSAGLDAGSGHLALLGGVDAWSGSAGPAVETRAGGWGVARLGGSTLSAGLWGSVEALPGRDLAWLDAWAGEVRLRGVRGLNPGVGVIGRGGLILDPAWGEVALAASARADGASIWLEGTAGPLIRGEAEAASAGGLALLAAGAGGPRIRGGVQGGLRAFVADGFPPWVVEADLQVGGGGRIQAWGSAGVVHTASSDAMEPVAGLALPGATVLRGGLGVMVPLGKVFALYTESGFEAGVGEVPYVRGRAMMGLVTRFGGARPQREVVQPAAGVRFDLDAPRARSVAVAGTFSDWALVPLEQGPDGTWTLVLPLPPGEYEYVWIVDGKARTPEASVRRRPDGFGGENGVLVVGP